MNPKLIFAAAKKNFPSILSYTAVGGVVLTGWLTHKAARKSDPNEPFKKNWKNYIPPILAGAGTIACIIGSNCAHLKVEAGLASGLAFYKAMYEDADKVLKTAQVMDASDGSLKDGYSAAKESETIKAFGQESVEIEVYEPYTNQYFKTTQKEILWAELEANKLLSAKGTVRLNDVLALYRGCKQKPYGNKIGWSWNEDWFNECSSYYWHGGWIELTPQWRERNGKTEFIMEYGIQPMELTE